VAATAALVAAPVGWGVTDHLERDNDFCVACHLEPGVPLHEVKHADLGRRPPATLAAAHAEAGVVGNAETRDFRCIDCHGGTGALGRLRVKILSGRDAFWYVVGRFEEPEVMHWPLLDADCRKCHSRFEERAVTPGLDPRFHELAAHNVSLGVSCVTCHLVHEEGGLPEHDFLHPEPVRAQCGECHPEMLELARAPLARRP
jgi:hypothetical protein